MSQSKNIISRWTKTFLRYGRDGVELAKGIWNHTRNNGGLRSLSRINNNNNNNNLVLKPILLDHARQSNKVANTLLQMDKQVGLIKYYGVTEFIKQRFKKTSPSLMFSTSTSSTSNGNNNASNQVSSESESESSPNTTTSNSISNNNNNNNTPARATIAFMVTASMKEELKTRLGYDVNQIKQMTPLQASLILNHNIDPIDKDTKLPQLENEHENQIEKERKDSMERIAFEQQEQEKKESSSAAAVTATATATVVTDGNDATAETATAGTTTTTSIDSTSSFSSSSSSKSRSVLNDDNDFGEIWYEVIETNNTTGETSRVGLYLDENEAILGKEVRQDIADNKNIDAKFEKRQITKEQLKKIYNN